MSDTPRDIDAEIRQHLDGISPARQAFDRWFLRWVGGMAAWVLRHWLLTANLVNAVILAGAVAVPAMRASGWDLLAGPIFTAYHIICEQRPERSYFLWGYQMAMDQRMTAIYASSLLAGIVYIPFRGRLRGVSWQGLVLLSLPMAVDGFTQLFGWRYSNWQLRTVTGTLFGVGTVWFMYPYVEKVVASLVKTHMSSKNTSNLPPANAGYEVS